MVNNSLVIVVIVQFLVQLTTWCGRGGEEAMLGWGCVKIESMLPYYVTLPVVE